MSSVWFLCTTQTLKVALAIGVTSYNLDHTNLGSYKISLLHCIVLMGLIPWFMLDHAIVLSYGTSS